MYITSQYCETPLGKRQNIKCSPYTLNIKPAIPSNSKHLPSINMSRPHPYL